MLNFTDNDNVSNYNNDSNDSNDKMTGSIQIYRVNQLMRKKLISNNFYNCVLKWI